MKSKLLTALTTALIVSVVLATYVSFASATQKQTHQKPEISQKQYNSFTLTAIGHAKNAAGENVDVTLSVGGSANGKLKTVFHLHTQRGYATVEGFDSIAAVWWQGFVVKQNNFIHLTIMMSSNAYGGRCTLWVLRGDMEKLNDNTMLVSLEAPRVVLPTNGYPHLTDLTLDGTINFK